MLVLLPAMGVPAYYYQSLVDRFTALGLPVVQVRFESTNADLASAIRDYAEAIELRIPAALECAKNLDPHHAPVILGHSLGGQLGLIAAAVHCPQSRLVLLASGTAHHKAFAGVRGAAYLVCSGSIGIFAKLFRFWPGDFFGFGGRQPSGVIRDWAHTVRTGEYRSSRGHSYDSPIAAFSGAVLAITVEHDVLAPEQSTRALLAKAPKASIIWKRYDSLRGRLRPGSHFTCVRDVPGVSTMIASWVRMGNNSGHDNPEARSSHD